ncbi:hypothetical protein Tco_1309105, partial [Tanacetum coccineum]
CLGKGIEQSHVIYPLALRVNPIFLLDLLVLDSSDGDVLRWGSKSSWGECLIAKSRITCDNTNRNTTLSEVHGVSLRITSVVRLEKQAEARLSTVTGDRRGVPQFKG